MDEKSYSVSQVARLARVTVRTLHHYDEIGLLAPSERTSGGYRRYGAVELRRLHQVLLFRELGFSLDAIAGLLEDPAFDRRAALEAQRDLLFERIEKTHVVIRAVDAALAALEEGREMESRELFEGFDAFEHAQHEDEARERWGRTDAYRESARRTKRYTKDDWAAMKAESEEILSALAQALGDGRRSDDDDVLDLAERHRLHIARWFYPCSHTMHAALGEMYLGDPRFEKTFETRSEGLAEFVVQAIRANAARA